MKDHRFELLRGGRLHERLGDHDLRVEQTLDVRGILGTGMAHRDVGRHAEALALEIGELISTCRRRCESACRASEKKDCDGEPDGQHEGDRIHGCGGYGRGRFGCPVDGDVKQRDLQRLESAVGKEVGDRNEKDDQRGQGRGPPDARIADDEARSEKTAGENRGDDKVSADHLRK